jgi:hypothetical protein
MGWGIGLIFYVIDVVIFKGTKITKRKIEKEIYKVQ